MSLPASVRELNADPMVERVFERLYNFDFAGAHRRVDEVMRAQPGRPYPHALRAITYLFSELDRMGILEADLFKDDRRLKDKTRPKLDPAIREKLFETLDKTEAIAQEHLAKDPKDAMALFALCAAKGIRVDYAGLVEKKLFRSLSLAKESHEAALALLKQYPDFHDANLTIGFSEYFLGSLPFFLRWFVPFEGVEGKKENGYQRMEMVAEKGLYLGPFARMLLAIFHLRDKRPAQSRDLLADLVKEYPGNTLLRRELEKLNSEIARMPAR